MRCPSGTSLAGLVDGGPVRQAVSAHVAACASCRRVVEMFRRIDASGVTLPPPPDDLVGELLAVPHEKRASVVVADRFLSAEVGRRFSSLAANEYSDLNAALSHAQVATAIASKLATRLGDVAELEFEAWKNRSTIHRERGEGGAARVALVRARAAAERCSDRELKFAVLDYAEATICATRDCWEPAIAHALLDRCEPVFSERDPNRLVHALSVRGRLHLWGEEYEAARTVYEQALAASDPSEVGWFADARRNLAGALIQLGRLDDAKAILRDVRAVDVDLGRTLRVVKADSLLALIAEKRGEFEAAAGMYESTSARYAAAGEIEASVVEGKDHALALVAAGRIGDACAVLRRLLAATVGDTDRRRFTATALAYLRDLAEANQITLDVASQVRGYIDMIHARRATPFVPPISPHVM